MTHRQLTWLGVLSVIVTAFVLIGGVQPPGLSAAARAALRQDTSPTTPQAVAATTATEAETTPASGVAGAPSDDSAAASAASDTPESAAGTTESETATAAAEDDEDNEDSGDDTPAATTPADDAPAPTNVKHVFVITLAGKGFDAAFGAGSAAPYLAGELRPKGTLLTNFSSLGRAGLPDRIAFIGGQPPNPSTKGECTTYKEIPPLTAPSKAGQITTDGCVYPNSVISLGDQLTAGRLTWQAYAEDHEKGPGGPTATCRRPVSNEADGSQLSRPGDAYAARNNPFIYFHSLLDLSGCDADVGPLTTLEADLATPKKTPNLSYIAPSLCHDGSESPCADGGPGGLEAADGFLKTWVPKILSSSAYKEGGLLVITFAGGPGDDTPTRNGTLLLSRFAEAGGTDDTAFDPYSLLRSTEDLLGLKPLANAADAKSFAGTVLASARVVVAGDD